MERRRPGLDAAQELAAEDPERFDGRPELDVAPVLAAQVRQPEPSEQPAAGDLHAPGLDAGASSPSAPSSPPQAMEPPSAPYLLIQPTFAGSVPLSKRCQGLHD